MGVAGSVQKTGPIFPNMPVNLLRFLAPLKAAALLAGLGWAALPVAAATFTNPIVRSGADPWIVVRADGSYLFTSTATRRVELRTAKTLAGLGRAPVHVVWTAPDKGPNSRDIWAPEIHAIGTNRWAIYYTATTEDGSDSNRRIFALESATDDPFGEWRERGKMAVPGDDHYAIDGTLFRRSDGELFFLWSGREVSERGPQCIYIAKMSDPWTLVGPRVKIAKPEHAWEKHGWEVNEGPEVLERNGRFFVVFSGSGGTTPNYCLGLLTHTGGDLLDAKNWKKSPEPVFIGDLSPEGKVFTVGHNGFFKSPDGTEDWIVYHGKDVFENQWRNRTARAQRFTWKEDGSPDFGKPLPLTTPIQPPSGEANE